MSPDNAEAMDMLRELDPNAILIDLYTHPACKYCQELKALLKAKGLPFKSKQTHWPMCALV